MEQQPVPAPTQPKKPKLPLNRKILLVLAFVFLILLIPLVLLSTKQKPTPPPAETPKTWELILNYNSPTQTLSLKKLSLLDKEINQDFRSALDSPYELVVADNTDRALFRTKINITQQFIFQPLTDPISSASAAQQPLDLETIIYIPYQPTASKIAISQDYTPILQINVSPAVSFKLIPEVFAQTTPQSCGPLQVVFISDGYTNLNTYHQQVNAIQNKFKSTPPYSSQPSMFNFKIIDNQQPLGCTQGLQACMNNASKIYQIGYGSYPTASNFIVLVNVNNRVPTDSRGLANDIGGNMAMVYTDIPGQPSDHYLSTAVHEFLGHSVGKLYDRYVGFVYQNVNPLKPNIKSNCTDNPRGEVFWKQAGSTSAFRGCSNSNLYAPFPPSCTNNLPPGFSSLGSPETIMSTFECRQAPTFDAVEQAWITQKVLPLYGSCPAPTTTPTLTQAGPTSTPRPTPSGPTSTLTPLPTIGATLNNTTNYPIAKFTYPGDGFWWPTYVGITNRLQAIAQAPAGKTLTQLGIYRVPANTYATSSESWIPIGTTTCSSSTCNLTTNWVTTNGDRQTWQDWYLTVKATDSTGITCNDRVGGFHPQYFCQGGNLNVQILPGSPPEDFFFGYDPAGSASALTSTTTPTTPSTPAGSVYVCEEVPTSGGSQVQIKTLKCTLK